MQHFMPHSSPYYMPGQDRGTMSKLVVFTGGLATLKTTISKRIAQDLGVLCLNKDNIKEVLVDTIGFKNREENKKLSHATVSTMIEIAKQARISNTSLLLEANFKLDELEKISLVSGFMDTKILTVFLYGDTMVLYQRYVDRQSLRHSAHKSTGLLSFEMFEWSLKEHQVKDCIGHVITVDTTLFDESDYQVLLNKIKAFLD